MMLKVLLCLAAGFLWAGGQTFDNSFHHNVDFTADDNGERLKLHSSGVLGEVLDLDVILGIKRLVCVKDRILLVTNQSDVGTDWKVGQILLASSTWRCNATEDSPGTGIYAKIVSIYFPTDKRLSIHVVPAGPLDMIEEANIHLRYTPSHGDLPQETKTRHRRYLSNILTKILGNVEWHANFSTSVPFNEDKHGVPERKFTVHKYLGEEDLNLTYSENEPDADFKVRCVSCHGRTGMSYVFELKIQKVNNKPKLLKYTSQLEAKTHLETDMEVEFSGEMGVNYSRSLWETGPIELIRIPVAVVRQLPPVELALSYNTQALAHVHGYSRRAARARTGFTAQGKYTISQHFGESSAAYGDITSYNWESRGQGERDIDVKDTLNVTVDIFQKITFSSSISWKMKDISIDLSPPMDISVRPSTKLETSIEGQKECLESSLNVQGLFSVAQSKLTVEAFGISIWDVILNPEISKQSSLTSSVLSRTCLAHCADPSELGPPLSDTEVCGQMTTRIERGTQAFGRLQVLQGNDLLFLSEETAFSWCGNKGMPCTSCNNSSSSNTTSVCADRYVSARIAPAITKLSQLVKAEWPNASLVVLEAWDEPTSAYPGGQHGNSSLHYEGRAVDVTITGAVDEETLHRLGSLSVCSGFEYVKVNRKTSVVHVATRVDGYTNSSKTHEETMFEDMIRDDSINNNSASCSGVAPGLNVGDTIPSGKTLEEVCGPPQLVLDRVNRQDLESLFYYDRNDVVFLPEGRPGDVCGHSTRRCRSDCQHHQNMTEPWTWCSTRLMTPRMALKLRQLAKLANTEGIVIQVARGFTEEFEAPQADYFTEGRGLQLMTRTGTTGRLAVLAGCSGFDFTHVINSSVIEVFVRSHKGSLVTRVEFPDEDATTFAVDPPPHQHYEYQYPIPLVKEVVSPNLVSGFYPGTFLSEHYKVKDVLCPHRPYFRVDSALLLCLDLVTDEYGQKVEILPGSGYRTQSVNMINFDIRHPEERYRFQTGQAVELRPPGYHQSNELVTLAKIIFRSCTPFLREEMRGVGLGCHQDKLYLDIRSAECGNEMDYITVWKVGNSPYCREVVDMQQELLKGGPVITAFDRSLCSFHPLGQEKRYLTFQFQQKGICSTSEQAAFCSTTLPFRQEESRKLQERMTSAAGNGRLPRMDIHRELDKCVVTLCGGCPGTGTQWDDKVKACSVVVDRFITRATRAFPDLTDRTAFYNTETVESTLHSLACHDGNVCVENIQLYSLFMPLVTSRYRPDPKGSIERMMFSSETNPTPLLELVEQEMAYRAKGVVKVFIEDQSDFKDIRSVVKVLMVYNQNVTEVQFYVADDLDIDLVTADLQRNLDVWAGTTCPEHGRFAIAPFTFHKLSHRRRKRSLERSEQRNEARRKFYYWELEWMMKLL